MDPVVATLIGTLGGTALGGGISYLQFRSQRTAERDRLTFQLAHERGMDDRAYVRRGIEDAIAAYEKALRAIMDLKGGLAVTDPTNELHLADAAASRHDAQEALQAFFVSRRQNYLWLPADSKVPAATSLASNALLEALTILNDAPPLSEDAVTKWDAAIDKAAKAHRVAMNTVRDELGAAL